MQKRFLVTALIFILGFAAVWIYLAEQFEKMVENDVKIALKSNNSIISTNLEDVRVDKYKFKIHLGSFDILPNVDSVSYSFEQAEICYNPFKGIFTIKPGGDKIIAHNNYHSYYIKDPKMSISFGREIFSESLFDNDFELVVKQKDLKLFSKDTDELYQESESYNFSISHVKKDDSHEFKVTSESNDFVVYKSLIGSMTEMDFSPETLEEIDNKITSLMNKFSKEGVYSEFSIIIPDSSLDLVQEDLQNFNALMIGDRSISPMAIMAIADGKLGFNLTMGTKINRDDNWKFAINIDKKSGSNFDMNIQNSGLFNESLNDIYADLIIALYSNEGMPILIKKEELLSLFNKHHVGNYSSSIDFNFSEENYAHDLKITYNDKVARLQGQMDSESSMFNEKISFDNILDFIDYLNLYLIDIINITHAKEGNPEITALIDNGTSNLIKSLKIFIPGIQDLVKLLHKDDELKLGDSFESEFKLSMDRHMKPFISEINGQGIEELFKSPKFIEIIKKMGKAEQVLNNGSVEDTEEVLDTQFEFKADNIQADNV